MFLHRIKIVTLAGFTVWIDASWLILAALLTWTLALGVFPTLVPHLSRAAYWWMGVGGAIGLFISIVLHELSHALVARRYDMPIAGITLFIFGGVAELHHEPTSAKAEFLMAVAGPITSIVLGTIVIAIAIVGESTLPRPVIGVIDYIGQLNWILAIFNLVPGFPLDGGRILRAALWGWKKDFARATRIAAGTGQFFGLALILLGGWQFVTANFVDGTWLFFIGLFLHGAAGAARRELEAQPPPQHGPMTRTLLHSGTQRVDRRPDNRAATGQLALRHLLHGTGVRSLEMPLGPITYELAIRTPFGPLCVPTKCRGRASRNHQILVVARLDRRLAGARPLTILQHNDFSNEGRAAFPAQHTDQT